MKKIKAKQVDLIEQYNKDLGIEQPRRQFEDLGNGYSRVVIGDYDGDRPFHINGRSAGRIYTDEVTSNWEMSATIDPEILRTITQNVLPLYTSGSRGSADAVAAANQESLYTTSVDRSVMSQWSNALRQGPTTISSPNGEHRIVIDNNGITFYGNVTMHNEG